MRKAEREIKDFTLVEALIKKAGYIHLSMWDGERPYAVPVSFGYKDKALYFHSSCKGRKAECLKKHSAVGFSVVLEYELYRDEKACDFTAHFKSVCGTGKAVFLEDPAEKREALDLIMAHYDGPVGDYDDKVLGVTAVVRIDIEEITGKSNPPLKAE